MGQELSLGLGVNERRHGSNVNPFSAEAIALFARMSPEPDATEKGILNTFLADLKTAGVLDLADVIYSLDADTEANSKLNIVKDGHNLIKGTTPVFTAKRGWKGDGSGILNTQFNPNSSGINFNKTGSFSYGAFYYNMTAVAASSLGAREGSTKQLYTNERQTSDTCRVYHTATNTTTALGTNAMPVGLIMIDISGGSLRIFINGILKQTISGITIADMPNYPLYLFAINSSGAILAPQSKMASNVFIGASMSEAQHLAYFNACIKKFNSKTGNEFNTSSFLNGFNKTSKKLHKIAVCGDSIMANPTGGDIPAGYDEGDGSRPFRLTFNNVARRIYDGMSWNKATHKRLDTAAWTKSGTWTNIAASTVIEPAYSNEKYYESIEANAYIEIIIPDGKENFAFICAKDASFDTLVISLNGGDISAYGFASVNCTRARDHASDLGNHFFTVAYEGLPAGANTIRISKGNNTNKVRIWGGLYWSGNTLIVQNVSHNGHTMQDLINQHLKAEIIENSFDHVMFQITVMNEISKPFSIASSMIYFNTVINTYLSTTDFLLCSCHPFGKNPIEPTTNYYETYASPSMEEYTNFFKLQSWANDYSFVDVLRFFKQAIEANGGTLPGGEGGLTYTTDGQHLNESGNVKWMEILTPIFNKINS